MVLYAVIKFLAYVGHCYVGIIAIPVGGYTGTRSPVSIALSAGMLRWFLGAGFGTAIFFHFPHIRQNIWSEYIAIYVPVRLVEWGLIARLLLFTQERPWSKRVLLRSLIWIVAGVAVSYAADLFSPEMLRTGKLCSGRCFC